MRKKTSVLILCCSFILLVSCSNSRQGMGVNNRGFSKGADIGWLQQMEATGYKFYNDDGVQQDCFQILKDHGINTIRLRTWVNPTDDRINGHCSKDETVAMAVRAKKWDMRMMINFHYSDSWADPGKQKKPAAWEGHDLSMLLKDVYDYTRDVMIALKDAGVTEKGLKSAILDLRKGSTVNSQTSSQQFNALQKYGRNLNDIYKLKI